MPWAKWNVWKGKPKYIYSHCHTTSHKHRRRQGVGGCERPPFGKKSLKLTVKFHSPEFFFKLTVKIWNWWVKKMVPSDAFQWMVMSVCFDNLLVLLLGIFRRVPCPSATRGCHCALLLPRGALPLKKNVLVIYDTSSIREPPKVS
jgi:hypothetical protein